MTTPTSKDVTFIARIERMIDEVTDVLECVEMYRDDIGEDQEATPGHTEYNLLRGVMHKLEEARGPLESAFYAAVQADRASRGVDIMTGLPTS